MKLKTIEVNGAVYAELSEGKPIYVHDDGKELPFDAPGTASTISRLNAEAKGHREGKETALERLKAFEGIDDAAAALKALKVVSNLDAKKLVDAGEVEKIKIEAIKAVEEKYAPVVRERDQLSAAIVAEKLGGGFARSKFIAEKVAVPAEMMQATFGQHFKVENGSVIGYDSSGNKLFSRTKPGEVASIDEALEMIVDAAPFRDRILKGTGANGSGGQGSGAAAGVKQMSRTSFDAMPQEQRMPFIKAGGVVAD